LRLLFIDINLPEKAMAIMNGRFVAYLVFIAFASAAAYIYTQKETAELDNNEKPMFSVLALAAAVMAIIGSNLEMRDFVTDYGQWTVALWSFEALALIILGFKIKFQGYRNLGKPSLWCRVIPDFIC